jgi:predicted metal-dependent peptidase
MKYYLIMFIMLWATSVFAEPTWMAKPVQCGGQTEVETLLERDNQKPLLAAMARVAYDDGNGSFNIAEKPVILFYNPNENMYSLVEFNPEVEQACVISFGGALDFNVADWYYGDKNN